MNMLGVSDIDRSTAVVASSFEHIICRGIQYELQLEQFYLRQEAYIRQHVAILDELQAAIADERRCLEVQHQECRGQIRNLRKNVVSLEDAQMSAQKIFSDGEAAAIIKEEVAVERQLKEIEEKIKSEDECISQLLDSKYELDRNEDELEKSEKLHEEKAMELNRALMEIYNLNDEVERRKKTLLSKQSDMTAWNYSLDEREKQLLRCQAQLCEDMRRLERDENVVGVMKPTLSSTVTSTISQREVMDDHDMSIDHEAPCEEIDRDE